MENKATLKTYFESGDRPTQSQFEKLIDSNLNALDDKASTQDAINGTNNDKFSTPKTVLEAINQFVVPATVNKKGIVQTATIQEVEAGVDTSKYVTPEGAKKAVEKFSFVKSVNGQTGNVNISVLPQDSLWQTIPLQNGFQNFGNDYVSARYRKISNVVYIEGTIKRSINGANVIIFQLPLNFRPSFKLIFSTFKNGGNSARIDIDKDGNVIAVIYDMTLTSLTGISFPV